MINDPRIFDLTDATSAAAARCRMALECLAEADAYARDVGCDPREFAPDWDELRTAGVAPRDLRWLMKRGYVASAQHHGVVRFSQSDGSPSSILDPHDRFLATRAGLAIWESCNEPLPSSSSQVVSEPSLPHWDAQRRTLCVGNALVKRFRQPSPVQELILTAFEEEGWPQRITDPLPGRGDQDPKRRLHDAIRSLNQNQVAGLIRFGGDGTGEGVLWELAEPATEAAENRPRLRIAA